jgi:DnaK suppressor protein
MVGQRSRIQKEDEMTKVEIQDFRRKLLVERERVMKSMHRNAQHAMADLSDTAKDSLDRASASHDRDVIYLLQDSEARRLRKIEEVLIRMEEDDYGTCVLCEEPIGKARLEAIPWSTNCVRCQEAADHRRSLSRGSAAPMNIDVEYDAA